MRFTSETISDGVSERRFTLDGIPGVLWAPAGATGPRPLVLLGHGGGQDKTAPGVVARARRYVTNCGFAAAAIDAPGHGGRPKTGQDERFIADVRPRMLAGEPVWPRIAEHNANLAERGVSRESGLALFDAFGSAEKTLHANTGRHGAVPPFEVDSAERFFTRHLGRRERLS